MNTSSSAGAARACTWFLTLTLPLAWMGCSKSEPAAPPTSGSTTAPPAAASAPAAPAAPAAATPPPADGPMRLEAKWTPGRRLIYETTVSQSSQTLLPQMPQPLLQTVEAAHTAALTVLGKREDGGSELEMQFQGARATARMNARELFAYDSASTNAADPKNPVGAAFQEILQTKLRCVIDRSNVVQEVEGLGPLDTALTRSAPAQARPILAGLFGKQALKQLPEVSRFLPDHPVKVGDSWPVTVDYPLQSFGSIQLQANVRFTGWEERAKHRCAVLESQGTITAQTGPGATPLGAKMQINEGKATGKAWFDPGLGALVESTSREEITLLLEFARPGATPAPQTITNFITQSSQFKLVGQGQIPK